MISTISAAVNFIGNPIIFYYARYTDNPNYLLVIGWFFLVSLIHPYVRGMVLTGLIWLVDLASSGLGAGIGLGGIVAVYFALVYASALVAVIMFVILLGMWLHSIVVIAENVRAWRNKDDDGHGSI